eukprot:gene20613-27413_t
MKPPSEAEVFKEIGLDANGHGPLWYEVQNQVWLAETMREFLAYINEERRSDIESPEIPEPTIQSPEAMLERLFSVYHREPLSSPKVVTHVIPKRPSPLRHRRADFKLKHTLFEALESKRPKKIKFKSIEELKKAEDERVIKLKVAEREKKINKMRTGLGLQKCKGAKYANHWVPNFKVRFGALISPTP